MFAQDPMALKTEYQIGGCAYLLTEQLSYQQGKWLGQYVLNGIDLHRLDYATLHDVIRDKGPLAMAICLIDVGMTRTEHSRLSWQAISLRAELFAAELSMEEVLQFAGPFFRLCRPASMAMLMPGRVLLELMAELPAPSPAPGETGSSGASSRSVEETLHDLLSSSPNGDRPSPSPISGDASSERSSTAPSLAGSASSFPG